eukprot:TRINITY_DN11613_c0_g1_i1.p1 TRINITY_DN11613_c0_g1~~TRINITY_DN11613_c0_g1_i1.p1  ORF type:complete len:803 (+),score=207.48 TRINITY_DN11613_c0_g1_i1:33-2441(+)
MENINKQRATISKAVNARNANYRKSDANILENYILQVNNDIDEIISTDFPPPPPLNISNDGIESYDVSLIDHFSRRNSKVKQQPNIPIRTNDSSDNIKSVFQTLNEPLPSLSDRRQIQQLQEQLSYYQEICSNLYHQIRSMNKVIILLRAKQQTEAPLRLKNSLHEVNSKVSELTDLFKHSEEINAQNHAIIIQKAWRTYRMKTTYEAFHMLLKQYKQKIYSSEVIKTTLGNWMSVRKDILVNVHKFRMLTSKKLLRMCLRAFSDNMRQARPINVVKTKQALTFNYMLMQRAVSPLFMGWKELSQGKLSRKYVLNERANYLDRARRTLINEGIPVTQLTEQLVYDRMLKDFIINLKRKHLLDDSKKIFTYWRVLLPAINNISKARKHFYGNIVKQCFSAWQLTVKFNEKSLILLAASGENVNQLMRKQKQQSLSSGRSQRVHKKKLSVSDDFLELIIIQLREWRNWARLTRQTREFREAGAKKLKLEVLRTWHAQARYEKITKVKFINLLIDYCTNDFQSLLKKWLRYSKTVLDTRKCGYYLIPKLQKNRDSRLHLAVFRAWRNQSFKQNKMNFSLEKYEIKNQMFEELYSAHKDDLLDKSLKFVDILANQLNSKTKECLSLKKDMNDLHRELKFLEAKNKGQEYEISQLRTILDLSNYDFKGVEEKISGNYSDLAGAKDFIGFSDDQLQRTYLINKIEAFKLFNTSNQSMKDLQAYTKQLELDKEELIFKSEAQSNVILELYETLRKLQTRMSRNRFNLANTTGSTSNLFDTVNGNDNLQESFETSTINKNKKIKQPPPLL